MNKSVSKAVEGIGYDEYKLGDYSNWLQNRVENQNNWKKILSCLKEGEVCAKIEDPGPDHNESIQAFYHQHLSAAQVYVYFKPLFLITIFKFIFGQIAILFSI